MAIVDYATIIGAASSGSLRLQANLTAAMGRHVLSDVVVIFGLEDACKGGPSSRLAGKVEQLHRSLRQRPGILDVNRLSSDVLEEKVAGYEPQAAALSSYFLMSLPAAVPDGAVREDWRVGVGDRDETPFAVSDPFKDSE
ncbi:MAG: hypothetical protein WDO73_11910 [Ignavibacteriota bacterium]